MPSRSSGHGGHRHGEHRRHRDSKKKEKSKSSSGNQTASSGLSFLFTVFEFELVEPQFYDVDCWGNALPPTSREAYVSKRSSDVFRYENGDVTHVREFRWIRRSLGEPGYIYYLDDSGNPCYDFGCAEPYKTYSVFACNPHLPIIYVNDDVSLGYTSYRLSGESDGPVWSLLSFSGHADPTYEGVSFIRSNIAPGRPYVCGRKPSWMPGLVPETFANVVNNSPPPSKGLAGELPVILGLMAFSDKGKTKEIFAGNGSSRRPCWRSRKWHGHSTPRGCKT